MRVEVNHFMMPGGETINLEDWKLINDITTEEEMTALEITKNQDGSNFELKEFVLIIKSVGSSTNGSMQNKNAIFTLSGYNVGYFTGIAYGNGLTRTFVEKGSLQSVLFLDGGEYNTSENHGCGKVQTAFGGYDYSGRFDKITSVKVTMQAGVFGAGSRMILYGR